ncbi:MAG: ATP-binding cassette domain-containing protein, partial [Pseudomonadota bacterium]
EARAQALATKAKLDAQRRHMQAFVDRFRAKASKAKQAQSRLKAIERLAEVAPPSEFGVAPFTFKDPKLMAPPIVRLVDANLGYATDAPVLRKLNLRIDQDDRIVILGANGQGKSTLVKTISGRLALLGGDIFKHKKLKIAYFSQHQTDELLPTFSAYDHVRRKKPDATEAEARSLAAQLGFGADKADTKVSAMSGGEKARLLLGLIGLDAPHMMILDEPTNHLDIESREALADALNAYSGAVLLITHDAHLAELVGERLWLVNDGSVATFDGDLDDYRSFVLDLRRADRGARKQNASATSGRTTGRQSSAKAREALAPLKKDAELSESRIGELNAVLARLDAALADPDLYAKDVARATKLQRERAALVDAISSAEDAWLAALERYEAAKAAQQEPV